MDAPASLIIDPMNILGEEGGRFKRCVGFFEPPERKGGWRATRKKRCVTCRPHRSLKDSVLCLRLCLAPAQNIKLRIRARAGARVGTSTWFVGPTSSTSTSSASSSKLFPRWHEPWAALSRCFLALGVQGSVVECCCPFNSGKNISSMY
jgi:hypothetical protein